MGFSAIVLLVCALVAEHVQGQEIVDGKNVDSWGHLSKIPRRFEVRSENAIADFKKYIKDIQDLTGGKNITLLYKVKVEVLETDKKVLKKRKMYKKMKSKKYNVPLKKQNMKLSNGEALLRKLAEENGRKLPKYEISLFTTIIPEKPMTTKQIKLKYKPILRRVKTNYTKIIKPVRSKIITLN